MKCLRKKIWTKRIDGLWGHVHDVFGRETVAQVAYDTDISRIHIICKLIAAGINYEKLT